MIQALEAEVQLLETKSLGILIKKEVTMAVLAILQTGLQLLKLTPFNHAHLKTETFYLEDIKRVYQEKDWLLSKSTGA